MNTENEQGNGVNVILIGCIALEYIIIGKRYVPEKEYIHMISSYITADWSNIE